MSDQEKEGGLLDRINEVMKDSAEKVAETVQDVEELVAEAKAIDPDETAIVKLVDSMADDGQVAEELEKNELSDEALARIEEAKKLAESRVERAKQLAEENKARVAELLEKQKADKDEKDLFEEQIRDVGQDLAEEVFRELRQKQAYDELTDEEHDILVHVVKRKASVLKALEIAHKVGDKRALKNAQNSAADLKSIEAGLDLIHSLRVREIMKSKMKELALKACSFALSLAL